MSVPEGWKRGNLGSVLEPIIDYRGQSVPKAPSGIPLITARNVKLGHLDFAVQEYISKDSFITWMKRGLPQPKDVIFTTEAPLGNTCLFPEHGQFALGQRVVCLRGKKDIILNEYIFCFLLSEYGQNEIHLRATGSTAKGIKSSELKKVNICFPSCVAEQKKIAAILSTWDKAIEATDKLLENARQQKKALMQQLLIEGKKRLPGFSGKLRELSLSKFCSRITERNNGASKNVMTISGQQGFVPQRSFFSKQIASDNISSYFLVKNGDFVYNKSYCNGYPMGAIKRLTSHEEAVVTTLYICFSSTKNYAHSDYLEQYFEAGLLNTKITQIATEGGRAHGLLNVKPADFMALRIPLPPLPEQQAIARVLTTADKEIDALTQKAALLRQEKRALMQQLLTGKKRVRVEA